MLPVRWAFMCLVSEPLSDGSVSLVKGARMGVPRQAAASTTTLCDPVSAAVICDPAQGPIMLPLRWVCMCE